ncbi:hypothetical protein MRX96_058173 [Rhipicephalus microplus]
MWPVYSSISSSLPGTDPCTAARLSGGAPALEFQVPTVPCLFSYLCLPAKLRSRWPRFLRVTDRAALFLLARAVFEGVDQAAQRCRILVGITQAPNCAPR